MADYLTCENCGKPISRDPAVDTQLYCPECGAPQTVHKKPEDAAGPTNAAKANTYDLILATTGSRKINVIKQIRALRTELGLAGAKEIADTAPALLLASVSWEQARAAKAMLESEGAYVDIEPSTPASTAPAAQVPEPDTTLTQTGGQDVVLQSAGRSKIAVIKALRELRPELGLKDAKDLVDISPCVVLHSVSPAEAAGAKALLEEQGATVEI